MTKDKFKLIPVFILGLLIASSVFMIYGYFQLKKFSQEQQSDILQIIQAHNSLVQMLQEKGVIDK